jgi:hypothetical protein
MMYILKGTWSVSVEYATMIINEIFYSAQEHKTKIKFV